MQTTPIRILLVEDNPGDACLIREILAEGQAGEFLLETVGRLRGALERLTTAPVDIVLMDLMLPDGVGVENVQKIRTAFSHVPIVVLTGFDDQGMGVSAVHAGAQDYLIKGRIDHPLLVRAIRYAMERQRVLGELQAANVRMERLALLDPLTEILNRRGLERTLAIETERHKRSSRSGADLTAILVDLDDFKQVNDTLGHAAGDAVLKEIAAEIRNVLRPTDHVGRIGGDEFMILLPDIKGVEGIWVAERVRLAIAEKIVPLTSHAARVTASLGIASVPFGNITIGDLLIHTHQALHQSKQTGKNRVTCPERELTLARDPMADLMESLCQGDGLRTLFQPIYRLSDERLEGYELLTRGPAGAFEMPNDFFRICLEKDLLPVVDRQCFHACLTTAAGMVSRARYHVNLFPATLLNTPVEQLLDLLPEKMDSGRFCVEINEQQLVGDPAYLGKQVSALKNSGLRIAIDDVGFGRSCLESMILLEPDVVKIDRKCVDGVSRDPSRVRSLQRLLKVVESLGAEVVAEGIESREDLEVLRDHGVPYGQGFLWGEPAAVVGFVAN
ncbi:MAG: EAL domain-containing protein [Nitrospirae bacterium]|nr:EAL domain-containing protein [Nitrospirota bacterium]